MEPMKVNVVPMTADHLDELERLEDAALLRDIAHMPARVKCAELAWRTLSEMLSQDGEA